MKTTKAELEYTLKELLEYIYSDYYSYQPELQNLVDSAAKKTGYKKKLENNVLFEACVNFDTLNKLGITEDDLNYFNKNFKIIVSFEGKNVDVYSTNWDWSY